MHGVTSKRNENKYMTISLYRIPHLSLILPLFHIKRMCNTGKLLIYTIWQCLTVFMIPTDLSPTSLLTPAGENIPKATHSVPPQAKPMDEFFLLPSHSLPIILRSSLQNFQGSNPSLIMHSHIESPSFPASLLLPCNPVHLDCTL